jgi:hypothetical protein
MTVSFFPTITLSDYPTTGYYVIDGMSTSNNLRFREGNDVADLANGRLGYLSHWVNTEAI